MAAWAVRAAVAASSITAAAGASGAVAIAAGGELARQNFAVAVDPAWSRDGRRIAFIATGSRADDAPRALYVMNSDGSGLRRLTRPGFAGGWPTWSPDGRKIAFTNSSATPSGERSSDIYVVNTDGSGLRKIVSGAFDPAWGPGGRRIAFSRAGYQSPIMTASPDGSRARVVAAPPPESGGEGSCHADGYYEPTWSPDGEWVAFSVSSAGGECGFDVFIGASRGPGTKTKVLAPEWFFEPDWSPDGRRLAVTSSSPASDRPFVVAVYNLRTHRTRYLRGGSHPRWSPDGRRLVFIRKLRDLRYERGRLGPPAVDALIRRRARSNLLT